MQRHSALCGRQRWCEYCRGTLRWAVCWCGMVLIVPTRCRGCGLRAGRTTTLCAQSIAVFEPAGET